MQQAVEELEYFVTFNWSISQTMQRTMRDLSEGVFISMANLTLAHRDSYLKFMWMVSSRGGLKPDTLTALRTAPVHLHSLFPRQFTGQGWRWNLVVRRGVLLAVPTGSPDVSIRTLAQVADQHSNRIGSPLHWPGSKLETGKLDRKVVVKPQTSPKSRPRVQGEVNDNYCVLNVAGVKDSTHIRQERRLEPITSDQQERDCILTCKLFCCKHSFCHRVATKERRKSQLLLQSHRNKACERCFLCRSLEFCKYCHKCPNCKSTCRGKATSVLGEVGSPGFESKNSHNTERGLHPPLPVQTQSDQVTNCHKQLCQPTKTVPPFGGTVSADEQKCSGTGTKPKLTRVLQPAIFGNQTQQPVETGSVPEHLEHLPKHSPSKWRPQRQ